MSISDCVTRSTRGNTGTCMCAHVCTCECMYVCTCQCFILENSPRGAKWTFLVLRGGKVKVCDLRTQAFGGVGGSSPKKIRCSEITSSAI